MGGSEHVAERVVQEIDEGRSVQVSVTHHLRGKESLTRTAAEQTSHHPIAHVHVMGHFLRKSEIQKQRKTEFELSDGTYSSLQG